MTTATITATWPTQRSLEHRTTHTSKKALAMVLDNVESNGFALLSHEVLHLSAGRAVITVEIATDDYNEPESWEVCMSKGLHYLATV